jgi:PTH1 family peptidyl-tRNA hydrolase
MALFQKKPIAGTAAPLYSLGLNKTILIVGLGNPGKEYDGTRHNIGFACVDEFARANDFPGWVSKKDLKGLVTSGTLGSARIVVIKPATFMNLSGEAVQAAQRFYKVPPEQIVVVHDELDIPFGQIRTRMGGGSAGHNGIKSIMQHVDGTFGRVRIGIGSEQAKLLDSTDFVLQKFSGEEQAQLTNLKRETNSILTEYIFGNALTAETRSFLV